MEWKPQATRVLSARDLVLAATVGLLRAAQVAEKETIISTMKPRDPHLTGGEPTGYELKHAMPMTWNSVWMDACGRVRFRFSGVVVMAVGKRAHYVMLTAQASKRKPAILKGSRVAKKPAFL